MVLLSSADFIETNFLEHCQSVKRFESKSGPTKTQLMVLINLYPFIKLSSVLQFRQIIGLFFNCFNLSWVC